MNNRAVLAECVEIPTSAGGPRACGHVERLPDAIEVRLARTSSLSVSRLMVASCATSIEAYGRWIRMAGQPPGARGPSHFELDWGSPTGTSAKPCGGATAATFEPPSRALDMPCALASGAGGQFGVGALDELGGAVLRLELGESDLDLALIGSRRERGLDGTEAFAGIHHRRA
jgi:hypothetical protein